MSRFPRFTDVYTPLDHQWIDQRLFSLNYCDKARSVTLPHSCEEHRARASEVRRRVMLAAGLLPGLSPWQKPAAVTAPRHAAGVLIYDVDIETLPGLRLTGNLFVPEQLASPAPGILCPHGHWQTGRVHQDERGCVRERSTGLARLGFVVFAYDMIGYNDNTDLPHTWEPEFQKKANLLGISLFGLQCLNSMRAVDFLASRPEVDPARLGCTGASGGGSQSWFIGILDPRIKALAPVCMLSSHFQGGCPCEEGPLLRSSGVTSFDIVSALAPRPLLLPSVTGDWTNLFPDYEMKHLRKIYALYNAAENVENFHRYDQHNYNHETLKYVYSWFVRVLMGKPAPRKLEIDAFEPPSAEELWHGGRKPAAPTAASAARSLKLLKTHFAPRADQTNDEAEMVLRDLVSDGVPARDVVERATFWSWRIPGGIAKQVPVSRRDVGDMINTLRLVPDKSTGPLDTATIQSGLAGTAADSGFLFVADTLSGLADDRSGDVIVSLLEAGIPGMAMELLGSGDSASWLKKSPRNFDDPLDVAFNASLYSMRVQDILTAVTLLRERGFRKITLLAPAATAPAALAAAALLPGVNAVIELDGVDDSVWEKPLNYQALIGRIGGIAGLRRLAARRGVRFCDDAREFLPAALAACREAAASCDPTM